MDLKENEWRKVFWFTVPREGDKRQYIADAMSPNLVSTAHALFDKLRNC